LQVTSAPYGGSFSKISFRRLAAYSALRVGGSLIESYNVVSGRRTLPAIFDGGIPSAPIIQRVGFQALLSIFHSILLVTADIPGKSGYLVLISFSYFYAILQHSLYLCGGIITLKSGCISPVKGSSILSNN